MTDFDPRCNRYYLNSYDNPDRAVFSDPYIDFDMGSVCITLSRYYYLNKNVDGVVAMDLDMNWSFY